MNTNHEPTTYILGPDPTNLPRTPLNQLWVGDTIRLPQRVSGILVYDLWPVTLTKVVDCGGGSLVLCWDGGERLYTAAMQVGSPAVTQPRETKDTP